MATEGEGARRIEIGFEGGQVVAAKLSAKQVSDLRKAVERGGWHDLPTEDGDVAIDLGKVVFLRGQPGEHRVGFIG